MTPLRRVALALVHHPVVDRQGDTVTTAVTNLDIHDIARSSHTFGVADFFIVHPVGAQRELVQRIVTHWVNGSGAKRIPDRKPAMETVRIVPALDDVIKSLGGQVELWVTSAAPGGSFGFDTARSALATEGPPVVLCFGTGWGLSASVLERAAGRLPAIRSSREDGYNHLSVRAAAAIVLYRLLGE